MSKRWPTGRSHDEELPASGAVSRALVLGFIVAGAMGLAAGVIWIGWNLIR
jgi:hypothetical protein